MSGNQCRARPSGRSGLWAALQQAGRDCGQRFNRGPLCCTMNILLVVLLCQCITTHAKTGTSCVTQFCGTKLQSSRILASQYCWQAIAVPSILDSDSNDSSARKMPSLVVMHDAVK